MTTAATAPNISPGCRDIALLLKRVLKDDGSFFLNIAGTSSDPWIAAGRGERHARRLSPAELHRLGEVGLASATTALGISSR